MKGGFSFCGIDIADLGIDYAPENKDTYVYGPAKSNIYEDTFDGHNGGYYFGSSRQPKEFILRCYYEDQDISKGLMAKIFSLFKVGTSGKLIFKNRPWCYYNATVVDFDASDMHNYLNGLFTVTMKAYYPFARGIPVNDHLFYNIATDSYHNDIMLNTAILEKSGMVPNTSFSSLPTGTILLYNPGTERAHVGIAFEGTCGDSITIYNKTTDQKCRYVGFQTQANEELYTDGINGKTVLRTYLNGNIVDSSLAFLYHDYGFIELEPAFPILRGLLVDYNGTTVTSNKYLYQDVSEAEWYIGKYIYLGNKWRKITACPNRTTLTVETNAGSGSMKTDIVPMNEIEITKSSNTSISKLSFIYKPTYA